MAPEKRFKASTLSAEKAVEDVSEALPLTGTAVAKRFKADVREIEDRDIRKRVREEGERSLSDLKSVRKAAREQIKLARKRGDKETVKRLRQELKETRKGEEEPGALRKGAGFLFDVLDAPHHLVRQATTAAFGGGKMYERDISGKEWQEDVRRVAEEDSVRGHIAAAVRRPAQVLGAGISIPLGVGVSAMGALTDIPNLIKGERTLDDIVRTSKEVIDETRKDTEDVALSMYTDPSSFLSLGVGGASKNAGQAALRTALKSGLSREVAEQLAAQTAKLVQVAGGTEKAAPAAVKLWEKTFARAGKVAGEGEKAARSTFGEGMEHLGRGQLELHAPGLSQYSVKPLAIATGKDFAGGKALQKVVDPVLKRFGGRGLFDPTKQQLKTAQREAKALAETMERQDVDAYKAELAKLPAGSRVGKKETREALLDTYLDPKEKQIAAEKLDETLGPGAEQFAKSNEAWFKKQAQELQRTGILEEGQLAANPISGQYIPRQYKSVVQPLEEVAADALKQRYSGGATIARERKLQLPTDDLPYAKREKDIFKIVPAYAKQSARLRAQKALEDRLVKAYGVAPGTGAGSKLKQAMVLLPERGVELPADVANVLRGTFDQGMTTIGRALRNAGVGSSVPGRGLLGVVDAYTSAAQRMKGLVLKTPAYHAVNLVDDTVKMLLAGMHNPMGWLRRARQIMSGKAVNVGGRSWTLADANAHKIGQGAAARFERTTQAGTVKQLERVADNAAGTRTIGSRVREGAEKVNDISNRIGDEWENTSKIAHWLWRLEMGDSPQIAARRTFETLIDYGDRGKTEQILGWFMPFIKYAWEAPKLTARAAVRNPGAFNLMERSFQAAEGEGHEPRQYITERGRYFQPGEIGQQWQGNVREAFGGAPKRKGLSMGVLPRLTPYEAFKPITETLSGNLDPLAMMLGPLSKAAIEFKTEQDLMTKQPLAAPSLTGLFPAEAPVPEAIRASAGQNPWLSRYVPNFLVSPGTLLGANYAINQATGPAGPIATLGAYRPYTGRDQPEDIYAMQVAKYLFGQPQYETTPADTLWSLANDPRSKAALRSSAAAKKKAKQERDLERKKR